MSVIDPRLADYDWEHVFGNGYSRPTHVRTKQVAEKAYEREQVAEIIAIQDGANDEADWLGLFRMDDGLFLVIRAGCDYTGWGCQEGGSSDLADTLADAIAFGLTQGERDRLGLGPSVRA